MAREGDRVTLDARGQGPPLVLLHGLGATRSVWHRVIGGLAERRLVVTPDLPGFGDSPPAGPGFDLDPVADRIAATVADAAGPHVDLLGHSLGGAIAVTVASRHPDLVDRLVLSSPAGFAPRSRLVSRLAGAFTAPALSARRVVGLRLTGRPAVRRLLLATAVADGSRLDPADALLILASSRGAERLGAAVSAVAAADLRPGLRRLAAPVGLIWGERDRIFPVATIATIAAAVDELEVERIPDAGHVTQLERPGEFIAALERLLDRLPAKVARA